VVKATDFKGLLGQRWRWQVQLAALVDAAFGPGPTCRAHWATPNRHVGSARWAGPIGCPMDRAYSDRQIGRAHWPWPKRPAFWAAPMSIAPSRIGPGPMGWVTAVKSARGVLVGQLDAQWAGPILPDKLAGPILGPWSGSFGWSNVHWAQPYGWGPWAQPWTGPNGPGAFGRGPACSSCGCSL